MYLLHLRKCILENHQFLFICQSCMFQALIYYVESYSYFEINDVLKAVILQDANFILNRNWKQEYEYSDNEFKSYSSLFLYFLTWYEYNQFSHYTLYFLIKNKGIPFRKNEIFIDFIIKTSNLNEIDIAYYILERNKRLKENYFLSQLYKIFPCEIIEYITQY